MNWGNFLQELSGYGGVGMSNSVSTSMRDNMRKQAEGRTHTKEKADRATVEQVSRYAHASDGGKLVWEEYLIEIQCGLKFFLILILFLILSLTLLTSFLLCTFMTSICPCHAVQALDPRTRMVLFKMLNRGVFNEINGCISTGKEVFGHSSVLYLLMFILHILALKDNRMIRLYILSNSLAYDFVVHLSG